MIDVGPSLIEGQIKKDLVLASETRSLRRLLEASGLAFRTLSMNLEENTLNQATLLETVGDTDPRRTYRGDPTRRRCLVSCRREALARRDRDNGDVAHRHPGGPQRFARHMDGESERRAVSGWSEGRLIAEVRYHRSSSVHRQ